MLRHQKLVFQVFEETFDVVMGCGTVQGGCHSPALFSRVVALAAQRLQSSWEAQGEVGPFTVHALYVWFLWFVDD